MKINEILTRMNARSLVGVCVLVILAALLYRGARGGVSFAQSETEPTVVISESEPLPLPEVLPGEQDARAVVRQAQMHTFRPDRPRFGIMKYTIKEGDTAWAIAEKFGLRMESILWGNEGMSADSGSLRVGQEINILPVDGVLYTIQKDDTWERLEYLFGVKKADIVAFVGNDFPEEDPQELIVGQPLIIPNGRKPVVWQDPGPQVIPGMGRQSPGFFSGALAGVGTGTYIWPVSPVRITQPYWDGHPAIDIDTITGQPVYASDGGTVIFSGMSERGYGNLVIIDHGNGYWTYYAHNDVNLVSEGQGVAQGQQIALSGNTGRSTGDHLDFRVRRENGAFLDPMGFLPPL